MGSSHSKRCEFCLHESIITYDTYNVCKKHHYFLLIRDKIPIKNVYPDKKKCIIS